MPDLPELPLPQLPPRAPDSHKGTFGRAVLIGGSSGMSGAVTLAGLAALRSGAGLVQLIVPESIQPVVAAAEPSYMVLPWPADAGRLAHGPQLRDQLSAILSTASSVAIGPGLGRSPALDALVAWLYEQCPLPLTLDADALNALAGKLPLPAAGPRILTPHPGEFSRLTGLPAPNDAERWHQAYDFAHRLNASVPLDLQGMNDKAEGTPRGGGEVTLILKGHRSVITNGRDITHNFTGNPGMATGGSGDVLTGVVTGLLAQRLPPFDAARLGAHLHGLAGDLAAAELGETSLIASDLIRFLPAAFTRHAEK